MFATLEEWIAREAISFAIDSPDSLDAAVDQIIAALGPQVELLGLGEPTHKVEIFLVLRNRLFQRLVERHGYTAIAVESSFPRGELVNQFVIGQSASTVSTCHDIHSMGFSHGFGASPANQELIDWMRQYNRTAASENKLHFYGFDSPTEMTVTDSPRQLLFVTLDYLASIDKSGEERRQRIDALLGDNAAWENPAAAFDPTKSIGLSPAATALRIETEDLITELQIRRPELIAKSDEERYLEAMHYAVHARQMLNYHACLARASDNRIADLLGQRDAMMANNLAYILGRERRRMNGPGKVLVFAHNSHLKRGRAEWQWGPQLLAWWPAGSHAALTLGPRYAMIGMAFAESTVIGLSTPEAGTLEALLASSPGQVILIPTHLGQGLPSADVAALPTRSTGNNPGYFPFTAQSVTDFDALLVVN